MLTAKKGVKISYVFYDNNMTDVTTYDTLHLLLWVLPTFLEEFILNDRLFDVALILGVLKVPSDDLLLI